MLTRLHDHSVMLEIQLEVREVVQLGLDEVALIVLNDGVLTPAHVAIIRFVTVSHPKPKKIDIIELYTEIRSLFQDIGMISIKSTSNNSLLITHINWYVSNE
jgi:hypothetical protein